MKKKVAPKKSNQKKRDAVSTYKYDSHTFNEDVINSFDKKSTNFRVVHFLYDRVANVSIVPIDFAFAKRICDQNNVFVMPDENWTIEYNDNGKWVRFDYTKMK